LREKREKLLDSNDRERKFVLTPISITKMVNLGITKFHFVRRVPFRCFFTLKLSKKPNLSSRRFLISSFCVVFLRSFIGFSRSLGFFISVLGPNELKNKFLSKKNIDLIFSTTIITKIWGKPNYVSSEIIFLK